MTVAELIARLQTFDPSLPVLVGESRDDDEPILWEPPSVVELNTVRDRVLATGGTPAVVIY